MPYSEFDNAIVHAVDPSLVYVSNLYPEATTCFTILVEQGGDRCVLKVRRKSHNMWDDRYFHYEIAALERAAERQLPGVTRLRRVYDVEDHQAILKEYAEGTPGNRMDSDDLIYDPEFVRKLDKVYLDLHLAGIAKICFEPRKVVIDEVGEITLVDLSSCVVNTEVGMLLFSQAMREDSTDLTHMEQAIRRRTEGDRSLLSRVFGRA